MYSNFDGMPEWLGIHYDAKWLITVAKFRLEPPNRVCVEHLIFQRRQLVCTFSPLKFVEEAPENN